MSLRSACVFFGLVASAIVATAGPVDLKNQPNGIWSTGFDASGLILSGGATDPHYTIVQVPSDCSLVPCTGGFSLPLDSFVVIGSNPGTSFNPNAYPFLTGPNLDVPWKRNDASSMWIGPRADQSTTQQNISANDSSPWIYRLSFVLPADVNPFLVVINLNWISDNSAGSTPSTIRVNGTGVLSGGVAVTNLGQGSAITEAGNNIVLNSSNSNFVAGTNTLDFVVFNQVLTQPGPNPSGLRVAINSAQADGVPEPATLGLLAGGLLAIAMLKRHK